MAEFTDADVGLAPTGPVEFSDADIGLAPATGSPVTQAFAPAKPIPLDPANTPSFGSDVRTGLNQTSQALNAQSATAANISIDQLNARISYLEQGQPNHPAEFKMPEPARQQLLTRLMRERDAKTQQFGSSVVALGRDAEAAKSIPQNTGLQEVGKAKTVSEAFSAISENPWEVTRGMVGQGIPYMLLPIIGAMTAGPLGGLLAGASQGAITGGGGKVLDVLSRLQVDTKDPEAVKAALADPAISEEVRHAFKVGAGVDTAAGGIAGALGATPFKIGSTTARTMGANAAIQVAGQGVIGGTAEATKQLGVEGELTAGPLVMQALGEAIFAPAEGARATWEVAKTRTSQKLGRPATDAEVLNDPQAQQTLREAGVTDEQILTAAEAAGITSLDNEKDRKRFAILQDRLAKRRIEESLRPAPDNYGEDGRPVTSDDWRNTPKGAVSDEVQRRQDELANRGQVDQQATTQNGVTAQTARATEDGTINPQASNVVPRTPDERPIVVQPDGGAFRADDGVMQGRVREEVTRDARTLRLPAPGREVLTDAEIALQRAQLEGGNREVGRDVPIDGKRTTQTRAPDTLYGQEGRAPQTRDQNVDQRQAGEAFTLADRQRGRAGADVRDTQVAGRPQGVDDNQRVMIDQGTGYAVRFKNFGDGGRIWVEAYDPRTNAPLDGVQPFQVSTTALRERSYAVDPRRAQDFEARAGTPEGERMGLPQQTYRTTAPDAQNGAGGPASNVKPSLRAREGSDRLEPGLTQTGKRSTRNAFPEQAAGEAPAPKPRGGFGNYEEAMRDFAERQSRGQTEPPRGGPDYSKAKSSNQARTPDQDGRFAVDENGHVMSSAQGPIRFADQKQAAKWILNVGQKQSPDQIFEIAVHPTGKGFTARERGRSETPPPGGKAGPEPGAQPETNRPVQPEAPRRLEGTRMEVPAAEPPPRRIKALDEQFPDAPQSLHDLWAEHARLEDRVSDLMDKKAPARAIEAAQKEADAAGDKLDKAYDDFIESRDGVAPAEPSFDEKVRAERERLWAEDMKGYKRDGKKRKDGTASQAVGNNRMVEATARENIMRQEVGPETIRDAEVTGAASRDDITDIAQLYRRKEGQSPQEAWEDAYARWVEKNEAEALRDENLMGREDSEFDTLKVDSGSDAAKIGDIYTQEAQQIAREAQISRDSLDNIPFDEVPNGKREADRPADAAGRQDAPEQGAERGGTRQEARGGGERAGDYATDAGPDGGRQTVIPGAERDARGANQRRADAPLRGGDEAPPKGGLFDEDARNQATFFSNPFLDPAAWKGLAKSLGLHGGYMRHLRTLYENLKDASDSGSGKKTWTITDIGRALMWSNDGQLGALEKAYNSPTIAALRDWLHPEADMGRQGTSPKATYHEAVDMRAQSNLNKLSDVLEQFEGNKSAKDQIVRLVQNPGNIKRGTPIHDAAASIRSMLDDELKYLKAAGVDVGEVKNVGYWPRIVDAFRVLRSPEKFLRAASRQYLKDGLAANRVEADKMALEWLESIQMGGVGMRKEGTDFVMLGGTPNADFRRERVFGPSIEREPNNPLREFYVQDPADVLTLHFQRTARRAEWARMMGDDLSGWKKMKDQIVKEGGIAALPQVVDLIANATGVSKSYISPHARSAVAVVRSLGVFGTLSLAAASSIAETAMPAIRSGNLARLIPDIGRTIKALAGGMENERAWAEDLGVIVNAMGDSLLGRRYHALEAGNKFQQQVMNRYFRMTGLEQLTTAQRVVAVAGAQAYLRRQAINLTNGGKRTKSAQDFLSELGVSGKDAEGFSKWLLEQADGKPTSASVKDDGHYGSMYRTAMHRFIRQTNMDPNTSTRPAWANDPYKSLMFQLNSYTWAFQKNVLNRAGAGIVKGLTGKGYTMQDRMAFLAPAMLMPLLYAIQTGVGEVRDNIFADPTAKPKDEAEKQLRNLDRAGAFGQASPLMNFFTGVRYERDLLSSFAGPALGNLTRPIESFIKTTSDRNSPNTNTRERALAKDMYRGFIFPVVAGTMAAAAPMGVGALALQALNTGEAREGFTSAVAGPKAPERRGPPRPPQPQRPQRPARP